MQPKCFAASLIACFGLLSPPALAVASSQRRAVVPLHDNWTLQSSCKIKDTGEQVSARAYRPRGWYKASVPTTVLTAQVAAGEYPDPYFGMNLRKIPGMDYPIGALFPELPMSKNSPYACSWWYRTEFRSPPGSAHRVWLHFEGINYRANIWVNGQKLANANDVAGAYRTYEFDLTAFLASDHHNVLAVEVFAPTEKDLAMNWWDWNPTPPDKDMGLWGDVFLSTSGSVTVRYPQVVSHVLPDRTRADLAVMAELHNASTQAVKGILEATMTELGIRLRQPVRIEPGDTQAVRFASEQFPKLTVARPKLWWPRMMGAPTLYRLDVRFVMGGKISDEQRVRFGIREVTSELNDKGYRLFRINGERILIRGAEWAPDMLLRRSSSRLRSEFDYIRDLGLNTLRLEGKMETDEFYSLADEQGVLIMAGWCCCDIWQYPEKWPPENLQIATASLHSQILRMRSHPSMLVWLNGSDEAPPPDVERAYNQVLQQAAWPNPVVSSADQKVTPLSGSSGMKMTGPYDWVPPSYWLLDRTKYGGAWGFNTETSPGPDVPPAQSLRKFIALDHLWPIDDVWNFHAGGERFQNLDVYNKAMSSVYGPPSGLEDYETKSQAMAYEGERAMFEAYGRNKYTSTGVIQWMLNNAWPSLIWHLYDYYFQPAGGYYGAKKALEPVHIQYSYDDRSVVIVNSRYETLQGLTASVRVYDFHMKEIYNRSEKADVDSDGIHPVLIVPPLPPDSEAPVYFIALALNDASGKQLSSNFYWMPARDAVIDWEKTPDTTYTPVASYEDLTALNQLPKIRLEARAKLENDKSGPVITVWLHNSTANLAFQAHIGVRGEKSEDEILPVLWNDNYVELLPGESRTLTARYPGQVSLTRPTVQVDGWNVIPVSARQSAPIKRIKN